MPGIIEIYLPLAKKPPAVLTRWLARFEAMSDEELREIIRTESTDEMLLVGAIRSAGDRQSRELVEELTQRVTRDATPVETLPDRPPTWLAVAIEVLAKSGSEDSITLIEDLSKHPLLRAEAGFRLADAGSMRSIPILQSLVDTSADNVVRSRAAAVLRNTFGDESALRVLAPDLLSTDRKRFRTAFDAFHMIQPEGRDDAFVSDVMTAIDRQPDAGHLVTLMNFLRAFSDSSKAVSTLEAFLDDRRKCKDLFSPSAKGEVRYFAAHYIASNL